MKHLLFKGFLSLLMMFGICSSLCAKTYDFKLKNSDGVTIYYKFKGDKGVVVCRKDDSSKNESYSGDVKIPSTVMYDGVTYKVCGLDRAFNFCKTITSVTLPDDIEPLSSHAFCYCVNLKHVNVPSTQRKIEKNTFSNCSSLESLEITAPVTYIGEEAFRNCTSLVTLTLPETVDSIGNAAFYNCPKLSNESWAIIRKINAGINAKEREKKAKIQQEKAQLAANKAAEERAKKSELQYNIISDNTVEVTRNQYEGDIEIPETVTGNGKTYTVTRIGVSAFERCQNLHSVKLPYTIESIQRSAFAHCENLASVNIPSRVRIIDETAFYHCKSLTSIVLPASLEKVYNAAFKGCSSLQSVRVESKNLWMAGTEVFYECPVTNVTWADGIQKNMNLFDGTPYDYTCQVESQKKQQAAKASANQAMIAKYTKKYGAAMVNSVLKVCKNKQSPGALPVGAPLDMLIDFSKAYNVFNGFAYGQPETQYQDNRGSWKKYRISSTWGSLGGGDSWKGDWILWFRNEKLRDKTNINY